MIVPPHLAATLNNSGGGSGGNNNNSGNSRVNSGLSVTGAGGAVVGLGSHLGGATAGATTSLLVSGSQDSLSGFVLSGGGSGGGGNGNGSGSSGSGSSRTGSSNGSGHRILAVNRNIDDLLFGSDLDSLINDNIINGFKSLKVAKSHSQDNLDYHHRHPHLQQQQHPHHQQPFYHHYYSHQLHSLSPTQQQQALTSLHYQTQHHHLQQQQQQQPQQQVNHWIESDIITNSKMLTDKAKQKRKYKTFLPYSLFNAQNKPSGKELRIKYLLFFFSLRCWKTIKNRWAASSKSFVFVWVGVCWSARSTVDNLVNNWPAAGYFPSVVFKEPSLVLAAEEKVIRTNKGRNVRLVDVLLSGGEVPYGKTVSEGIIQICAIALLLFTFDKRNRRIWKLKSCFEWYNGSRISWSY